MINSNINFSPEIAEICGIHAGDGHLRKNKKEYEISGGFEEKSYYDNYVIPLFEKYFKIKIEGKYFRTKKTYGFRTNGKKIGKILSKLGFPYGAKSKIVKVPEIILDSHDLRIKRSFLRGYFDTDGCITFDKKIQNKNKFKKNRNFYPRILMSSISKSLINEVYKLCIEEEFNAKFYLYKSKKINENRKYILQINGKDNLLKWIKVVNPKNHVKTSRFQIWLKYGFCPTRTNYLDRLKILKGLKNPNSYYSDL